MAKTPKTAALLRKMWREYQAGEGEHPLASWARSSEWKDRCCPQCGVQLLGSQESCIVCSLREKLWITKVSSGEMEMHYGEALLWIQALEWFIREQGFKVPTWQDMEDMGWKSSPILEIQTRKTHDSG